MRNYVKMSLSDVRFIHPGMLVRASDERQVLEVLTVDYRKGIVVMRKASWWKVAWTALRGLLAT